MNQGVFHALAQSGLSEEVDATSHSLIDTMLVTHVIKRLAGLKWPVLDAKIGWDEEQEAERTQNEKRSRANERTPDIPMIGL